MSDKPGWLKNQEDSAARDAREEASRRAREAGQKKNNPYDSRSTDATDWNKGWGG